MKRTNKIFLIPMFLFLIVFIAPTLLAKQDCVSKTVHPHLSLPRQGGGIQGDNEYSPPLVGGVRGGGELLGVSKPSPKPLNLSQTTIGDPKSGNTVFRDCGTLPVNNKVVNANTELASSKQNLKSSIPQSAIQNVSPATTDDSQLDKAEFARKTKKLQIPFIANNGQVDDQVRFYAKTFGGTVFITKDGDIVYALPHTAADASPLAHYDIDKNETGYTGLTGFPEQKGRCIVHRALCALYPYCPWNFPVYYSETNSPRRDTERRVPATTVALKEEFVGAKVKTIQGEQPSVTKVSYFKGSDPEKWKIDISTYEVVNLGEVYEGIDLKLRAYGDNVEKLFYVKPGASPDQIKINLSGIQPPGNLPPLSHTC